MKKYTTKKDTISLWDKIAIRVTRGGQAGEYLSRIENIKRRSYVIEMPIKQSGNTNLSKGDVVDVSYNKHDAAYTFKASIKDLFIGEGSSAELEKISETERVQRRQFVRLDISGKISFRILDDPQNMTGALSAEAKGDLLNISAGGILFESGEKHKEGSLLVVNLRLRDNHTLKNILSVVKRVESLDDGKSLVGAEFINEANSSKYNLERLGEFLPEGSGTFDENLQKLVVQYIYKQQVESRKQGGGDHE